MYRLIVHSGPFTFVDVKCDRLTLLQGIADDVSRRIPILESTNDYYTDENAIGEWTGINPDTGEATGKMLLKGRDRWFV
jgi:hypothetical protein